MRYGGIRFSGWSFRHFLPWGNEDTQQFIDIMDKYQVKATFFEVGEWMDKYPESVKAFHDAGHEVMNHSNTHAHYPQMSADQADQSCRNVGAILEAAGVGFDRVIKTTCFLADMDDFGAFNEIYAKYFVSKPARSRVAVRTLPKGVLCEIEAIAVK